MAVQEGYLGLFFTPAVYLAMSLVSISVALLGVLSNILIIIIFYHVYGIKRFQSILWINLSGCQIAQCFAMVIDTLGSHFWFFSDGQWMCGARYLFSICMDQVFLGSYLVLLTERMAIVHLSMFHSLIPKLYTILLLYGWSFGLSFLFLVHNDILKYKPPLQCLTPFLNQLPQESATISLFSMTTLAILISLVSVMLSVPQTASKVEKLRQEIEGKGVTVTLFIGSLVLLLSAPRHILSLLYWMDSMDVLTFQVYSKISSMILRLNVLLPFIGLMIRQEFRAGVGALVTFKSLDPTRKKIAGQVTCTGDLVVTGQRESRVQGSIGSRGSTMQRESNADPVPVELGSSLEPLSSIRRLTSYGSRMSQKRSIRSIQTETYIN